VTPVLFTTAAETDVEEVFRWYEVQRSGLGAAFRHALNIAVMAVETNPAAYAILHRNVRRVLLPKFPYGALLPPAAREHPLHRVHPPQATPAGMALEVTMQFQLLDTVVLNRDLPVEFVQVSGKIKAIVTLKGSDLRAVRDRDILAVRAS
jgi:hypothetical protein